MSNTMKLAVIGAGAVGSALAFMLVTHAGYTDITMVARNKRLAQLQRDGAVVARGPKDKHSTRAPVKVLAQLDVNEAYDLVLVLVMAYQIDDALRSTLAQCKARTIAFVFGTIRPLSEYRDIVGADRFAFGFSACIQGWWGNEDGELVYYKNAASSPMTDAKCAKLWSDIGAATTLVTVPEMQSFLRTQVCVYIGLLSATMPSIRDKRSGASWSEAYRVACAMRQWFAIVRELGEESTSRPHRIMMAMPAWTWAGILWMLSRVGEIRNRLGNPTSIPTNATDAGSEEARRMFLDFCALAGPERAKRIEGMRL